MIGAGIVTRARTLPWGVYLCTLAIAFTLKRHYSTASASALDWILRPTAALVEFIGGHRTRLLPDAGWVSIDGSFVIAPGCAGVNFLLLVFVVLTLGCAHRFEQNSKRWCWLLGTMLGALLLTLLVNTLRICLSIELYALDAQAGWLDSGRVHRLAGSLIYLVALRMAWSLADRCSARLSATPRSEPTFAAVALLCSYLGMTLLLPLLNGALASLGARYVEHALTLIAVSACVFAPSLAAALRRRCSTPRDIAMLGSHCEGTGRNE